VDGDLHARELVGELDVTSIGGGAQVDDVRGGTRLEAVGGDVALRGVEGEVHFIAHGDGVVTLAPQAGEASSVEAGGDLTVRLPNEASVRLRLQAGGDLDLALPGHPERDGGATVVTLGTGEANLSLKAGGDLRVKQGGGRGDSPIGPGWQDDLEARVREQVRRSMERAGRAAGHARRGMDTPPAPAETSAVGSDERMLILRMLESGKINVDQAEKLFEALEGKA
jgi:hypothetical protein